MSDDVVRLVDEHGKTVGVLAQPGSIKAVLRPGESLIEVGPMRSTQEGDTIRVTVPYMVRTRFQFGK
jgi:hypothetical protein